MTVSVDTLYTSAVVQANATIDAVYVDKLYTSAAVQRTTANTDYFNNVFLDKLYTSAAIQLTTANVIYFDHVYADKIYVSVVISAPNGANAVSTATGSATAVGVLLKPGIGQSTGNSTVTGVGLSMYTMLPASDTVTGNWKNETNSSPLYPSVAKYGVNDSTYISGEPDAATDIARLKFELSPYANSTQPVVKYRINKYPTITQTPVDFIVSLQQNTTNVATWTHTNVTTTTATITQTLTPEQTALITDYDDLYIVLTSKAYPPP